MGTVSRRGYSEAVRRNLRSVVMALYFALAPSTVPDWRADPGLRTVAMLPIGEPMARFDSRLRP